MVPYYSRSEIERNPAPLQGRELLWVDDEIDLFFLQIQGSGRVELENGEIVRVGYSEQNGHPYKSIGRLLVERGELPLEKASMQGIKAWGQRNPHKLGELLQQNSSFVFFREVPTARAGTARLARCAADCGQKPCCRSSRHAPGRAGFSCHDLAKYR